MIVVAPCIVRLLAAMMEKAEIRACWKGIDHQMAPIQKKIPEAQFDFYPGRNTSQSMSILRCLQLVAQIKRPHASPKLHAAFIFLISS
eukprot:scaffold22241_cov19-Tisochrysis_lutea.AAC.3